MAFHSFFFFAFQNIPLSTRVAATSQEIERKESAKREAEAARESIRAAELQFYQDTVGELAASYNEYRRNSARWYKLYKNG